MLVWAAVLVALPLLLYLPAHGFVAEFVVVGILLGAARDMSWEAESAPARTRRIWPILDAGINWKESGAAPSAGSTAPTC